MTKLRRIVDNDYEQQHNGTSPHGHFSGQLRTIIDNRMRVYWSGAALALMADVELRRRSGGAELPTGIDIYWRTRQAMALSTWLEAVT